MLPEGQKLDALMTDALFDPTAHGGGPQRHQQSHSLTWRTDYFDTT
jgi:hypothetical protein